MKNNVYTENMGTFPKAGGGSWQEKQRHRRYVIITAAILSVAAAGNDATIISFVPGLLPLSSLLSPTPSQNNTKENEKATTVEGEEGEEGEEAAVLAEERLTIKEMFERGIYQHLVETRFDVSMIDIRRGESTVVPLTVEHYSNVWWEPVTIKNFQNRFVNYSPFSGQEIPVDDFLSYSPSSIFLPSNSSARATVKISIPENMPDEMLNHTIKITASFDVETGTLFADRAKKPGLLSIRILS